SKDGVPSEGVPPTTGEMMRWSVVSALAVPPRLYALRGSWAFPPCGGVHPRHMPDMGLVCIFLQTHAGRRGRLLQGSFVGRRAIAFSQSDAQLPVLILQVSDVAGGERQQAGGFQREWQKAIRRAHIVTLA